MGKMTRPLMLFLPIVCASVMQYFFHPSWRCGSVNIATLLIRCALMVMFFFLCLQLDFSKLKPQKLHGKLLIANLLAGVIPALCFELAGRRDLALVAFFTGMTPTANAAPVIMLFLNGRVEFVLTGVVLSNLVMNCFFIVLLPLITGNRNLSFAFSVFSQLLWVIALPACSALILRRFFPDLRNLPRKLKMVSLLLWSCTLFVVSATASEFLFRSPDGLLNVAEAAGISLLLCAFNFWLGARVAPRKLRRESSQTLGQKNTSLTIYLALTFGGAAGPFAALGPGFYVLWHNTYNAIQMYFYDRRKHGR